MSLNQNITSNNLAIQNSLNTAISTSSAENNNIGITGISTAAVVATSVIGTLGIMAAAGGLLYGGYRLYHYCKDKSNEHDDSNNLINAASDTNENIELQSLVQIVRPPVEAITIFKQEQDNRSSFNTNIYESYYKNDDVITTGNIYENVSNLITSNIDDLPPPIPPKISDPIIGINLSGELPPPPDYA